MIHEGTSMTITAKASDETIKGVVDNVRFFEHGPNAGRVFTITVRRLDGREPMTFIRNRAQLGGGWINKTHTASITPRSW